MTVWWFAAGAVGLALVNMPGNHIYDLVDLVWHTFAVIEAIL